MQRKPCTMTISSLVTTFGALITISAGTFASQQLPAKFNVFSVVDYATRHSSDHIARKQASTECTPDSEEYDRRVDALECDEDYIKAVQDGIERSTCKNFFYTEDDFSGDGSDIDCEPVVDSRPNVDNCPFECSLRQIYYYVCTYLWDDFVEINEECGIDIDGVGFCAFDEGDFCFLQYNLTYAVFYVCNTIDECSETCKDAVEQFREESGCCAYSFINDEDLIGSGDGGILRRIFSACDVEVPGQCTSSSPPQEFLECAGIEAAAITAPFYVTT